MTVTSGLVGSVGPGERRTATFFRGTVASELDFIIADEAALPLVRSTGTESRRSAWGFSAAAPWSPSTLLPVLWWIITPGPSLRTMLSGPQDWSFGGGIPR